MHQELRQFAWRVPDHIIAAIPANIWRLIEARGGANVIRNIDLLDVCAGKARITKWALLFGLRAIAVDIDYGLHLDINTDCGLATLVLLLLRVVPGGLIFIAAQCSSWVWMCSSVSGRTKSNPDGNLERTFVVQGNKMNKRCAVVCVLARLLGVHWAIEQPRSSMFFCTAAMRSTIEFSRAAVSTFPMSMYGHPCQKQAILVGTPSWLPNLGVARKKASKPTRDRTPNLVRRYEKRGKLCVTGGRLLKASQVYPAKFALEIVRCQVQSRQ